MGQFLASVVRSLIPFVCLSIALLAASPAVRAQVLVPSSEPAPQVDISQLTADERADLLSRLSDEQVRELMLAYMSRQAESKTQETPILDEVHQEISLFRERLGERLTHIGELPSVPRESHWPRRKLQHEWAAGCVPSTRASVWLLSPAYPS